MEVFFGRQHNLPAFLFVLRENYGTINVVETAPIV
jgi:hypothetical protein